MHSWMRYVNDETTCSIHGEKGQARQEINSESKKRIKTQLHQVPKREPVRL